LGRGIQERGLGWDKKWLSVIAAGDRIEYGAEIE
jgi:hypothetical protein